MQKNSQDFSMEEVMQLAKSPAGQQLLAMLRDAGKLDQATDHAKAGNYAQAMAALKDVLSTQEGQQLLKELGR